MSFRRDLLSVASDAREAVAWDFNIGGAPPGSVALADHLGHIVRRALEGEVDPVEVINMIGALQEMGEYRVQTHGADPHAEARARTIAILTRVAQGERETLGHRIRAARRRTGLTQAQVAEVLGVSTRAVKRWESDQWRPDPHHLDGLADILDHDLGGVEGENYGEEHNGRPDR